MGDVFTARIGFRDPDVLDVTRKSATDDALAFAPSWAILNAALDAREHCKQLRKLGLEGHARSYEKSEWDRYVHLFTEEMRASYRVHRAAWDALLARERVILVCYCTDAAHCHRTLLARDILPRLGARYGGELTKTHAQGGLFDG